jgi:hypothetical protein
MNHWAFITAAYAITLIGAAGVTLQSWRRMRAAEKRAEALKDRK